MESGWILLKLRQHFSELALPEYRDCKLFTSDREFWLHSRKIEQGCLDLFKQKGRFILDPIAEDCRLLGVSATLKSAIGFP